MANIQRLGSYILLISIILLVLIIKMNLSKLDEKPFEKLVTVTENFVENKTVSYYISTTATKTILYGTKWFKQTDMGLGLGSEIFSKCPYSNCYTTANINYVPFEQFDAVIFHIDEIPNYTLREMRKPHQVFIMTSQESPLYAKLAGGIEYNWTMTHRLDSDILRPYGIIRKQKTNYTLPTIKQILDKIEKNRTIAWVTSHCTTHGHRELIVEALNKFIKIDIYGKCGNYFCSRSQSNKCNEILEDNYLFYLAFENSYCQDYVTEKLYNGLKLNLVPIVYGLANYTKLAPPQSFINIDDFKHIRDLAKFLKYLLKNPSEYLKYLKWKTDYIIDTDSSNQDVLCNLCKKLNMPIKIQSYDNLYNWWNNVCEVSKYVEVIQSNKSPCETADTKLNVICVLLILLIVYIFIQFKLIPHLEKH